MTTKIKQVSWTIKNAGIVPGMGDKAVKDQSIFEIKGTIRRSDQNKDQDGDTFKWTPNRKSAGFTLDLSKFDRKTGTGTIVVSGTIKQNGRRGKEIVTGDALDDILNLA